MVDMSLCVKRTGNIHLLSSVGNFMYVRKYEKYIVTCMYSTNVLGK